MRFLDLISPHAPLLLAVALTLAGSLPGAAQPAPVPGDPIKIDSGLVSGKLLPSDVRAYLGIPYAAPPVDELRWREPRPVKPWTGVRVAAQYGNPCAQRGRPMPGGAAFSEDCLYLNVWAPVHKGPANLPVIVYIYGGGYSSGSSAVPTISGEKIAREGVVFVNFNYRLGVLGSLALPELTAESPHKASGNYVHLDEIAVFQWVRRNIARFGGNPRNVTMMGQSSGGIDVQYLQASPVMRGLFHKIVEDSGATFFGGPWAARPLSEVEQEGMNFQQRLGARSLTELRATPWEKLVAEAGISISEPTAADGYVLPRPAPEIFAAHRQNDVPAILNSCRDESFGPLASVKSLAEYQSTLRRLAGDDAEAVLKLYPAANDAEAARMGRLLGSHTGVDRQMTQSAQAAFKSPVYLSMFAYGERAGHGQDLAYWFDVVELSPAGTSAAREVADKMSDALAAFARTGNPNTPAIKWPAFDRSHPMRLEIGERIEAVPVDPRIDFFIARPQRLRLAFPKGGGGNR
jgi:para-nitrobenzyl esterase